MSFYNFPMTDLFQLSPLKPNDYLYLQDSTTYFFGSYFPSPVKAT